MQVQCLNMHAQMALVFINKLTHESIFNNSNKNLIIKGA